MSRQIIWIDPKIITKISPISASAYTRKQRILKYNLTFKSGYLNGDWDKTNNKFKHLLCWGDYNLFKNNKKSVYNWKILYNSIKKKGYKQNPSKRHVEVALGRNGEILFVDGRHRLLLAMEFNISEIPVDIVYIHKDYNFNNLHLIKNLIIPEFLYNIISKKWDKKIKIYHRYLVIHQRGNLVKKYLPLLSGLNVLEIGCNSGMMMWSIMKYANSLIELEKQLKYFNQSYITYKSLKKSSKVLLFNDSFKDFIIKYPHAYLDINALYASFVLYHMNKEEIDFLKTKILPLCKTVIIPNRQKERKSKINPYYLNRDSRIKQLLEDCGFKVIIDTSFQKGFSVIVGTK